MPPSSIALSYRHLSYYPGGGCIGTRLDSACNACNTWACVRKRCWVLIVALTPFVGAVWCAQSWPRRFRNFCVRPQSCARYQARSHSARARPICRLREPARWRRRRARRRRYAPAHRRGARARENIHVMGGTGAKLMAHSRRCARRTSGRSCGRRRLRSRRRRRVRYDCVCICSIASSAAVAIRSQRSLRSGLIGRACGSGVGLCASNLGACR